MNDNNEDDSFADIDVRDFIGDNNEYPLDLYPSFNPQQEYARDQNESLSTILENVRLAFGDDTFIHQGDAIYQNESTSREEAIDQLLHRQTENERWNDWRREKNKREVARQSLSTEQLIIAGHVKELMSRLRTVSDEELVKHLMTAISTLHITMVAEIAGIFRLRNLTIPDVNVEGLVDRHPERWDSLLNNSYSPIDGNTLVSPGSRKLARIAIIKSLISLNIDYKEYNESVLRESDCWNPFDQEYQDVGEFIKNEGFIFVLLNQSSSKGKEVGTSDNKSNIQLVPGDASIRHFSSCFTKEMLRWQISGKGGYFTCLEVDEDIRPDKSKNISLEDVGIQPLIMIPITVPYSSLPVQVYVYLSSIVNLMRRYKSAVIYLVPAAWQTIYKVSEAIVRPPPEGPDYIGDSHGQEGLPEQIYSLAVCIGESCKLSKVFNFANKSDVDIIDMVSYTPHMSDYKLADYVPIYPYFTVHVEPLGKFFDRVERLVSAFSTNSVNAANAANNKLSKILSTKLRQTKDITLSRYMRDGLSDIENINTHVPTYINLLRLFPIFKILLNNNRYSAMLSDNNMSHNMINEKIRQGMVPLISGNDKLVNFLENMVKFYSKVWSTPLTSVADVYTSSNYRKNFMILLESTRMANDEYYNRECLSLLCDLYNGNSEDSIAHMDHMIYGTRFDKISNLDGSIAVDRFAKLSGEAYISVPNKTLIFPKFQSLVPETIRKMFGPGIDHTLTIEDGTCRGLCNSLFVWSVFLTSMYKEDVYDLGHILYPQVRDYLERSNPGDSDAIKYIDQILALYFGATQYRVYLDRNIQNLGFFLGVCTYYDASMIIAEIFGNYVGDIITRIEKYSENIFLHIFKNWAVAHNRQVSANATIFIFPLDRFYTKIELNMMILYLYLILGIPGNIHRSTVQKRKSDEIDNDQPMTSKRR